MMLRWLLAALAVCIGLAASAQTPSVDEIASALDARTKSIDKISDQLGANEVSDADLDSWLRSLLDYEDELQDDADVLQAALEKPNDQLGELGPPPTASQPAESAEVARLRKSLTNQVGRLRGLVTRANLAAEAAADSIGRTRVLQRERFNLRITRRGTSPFSVHLWTAAGAEIGPAWSDFSGHFEQWWNAQQ